MGQLITSHLCGPAWHRVTAKVGMPAASIETDGLILEYREGCFGIHASYPVES
jgi:hypothetical protein